MNTKLLALYGLKYNPFTPEVPVTALHAHPKLESFCWRVENALIREGGFALVSGEPGTGKSVTLRLLASPIWIIDEAHLAPANFFAELPAFLNFDFDGRKIITIIFVGSPSLQAMLKNPFTARCIVECCLVATIQERYGG